MASETLIEQLERRADEYTDGRASYGPKISQNTVAAASLHFAAEMVRRHCASSSMAALVEGLHAQVFGVHSLGDPDVSHRSLADGGQIHEAAHALIRALPSADRIASLEAEVAALRKQMEHEAASMWRGAVSNTVAVVDRVRNQFAKGLRLKKNARLAHFDAELDIALGEWFDATRRTSPKSYAESEALFRALLNRGDGNG